MLLPYVSTVSSWATVTDISGYRTDLLRRRAADHHSMHKGLKLIAVQHPLVADPLKLRRTSSLS